MLLEDKDKLVDGPGSVPEAPAEDAISHYLRRTPGLKLFDVFLYPLLTNFVVFGISVGATYLTSRGGDRDAAGRLIYGKTGEWFHTRGEKLVNFFKKTGMSHEQADMSKMVFFSFADGSLIAPFVKLLEDRREKIACAIDKKLGTLPADDSVYAAEPKQTWGSVVGGRLLTCMIVVPTAFVMDKTGMNNVLFRDTSRKVGEYIAREPGIARNIARIFGKNVDIAEVSKVGVFEAFYTSVCTAGLYISSRCIAGVRNTIRKKPPAVPDKAATCSDDASTTAHTPACVEPPNASRIIASKGWSKALAKPPAAQFADLAEHNAVMERA